MNFSFKEILSVSMILFAIIDILGAIPVIIQLRQKAGRIESEQASLTSLVLMVVFLFIGEQILAVIGIDVSSFAIAGSFVIFIIAMEMVLGINFFKDEMPESVSCAFGFSFNCRSRNHDYLTLIKISIRN